MAGQGKVDWDSTDAWKKLIAAFIATGVKIDIRQVALYFGTTYDTLENRLRAIKKEAAVLKKEVETGARGEVPSSRAKSAPSTPRKVKTLRKGVALENVANGRVTKKSPSKKSAVKQEAVDSAANGLVSEHGVNLAASYFGENMDLAAPKFVASFQSGTMDLEENSFF